MPFFLFVGRWGSWGLDQSNNLFANEITVDFFRESKLFHAIVGILTFNLFESMAELVEKSDEDDTIRFILHLFDEFRFNGGIDGGEICILCTVNIMSLLDH